jgi:hypothetical protein
MIAACVERSTFSPNLSRVVSLLRQGVFRPAEWYRLMRATLSHNVWKHLDHLTRALIDLQPRRRSGMQQNRGRATWAGARP